MSISGTIPISNAELLAQAYVNIKSTGIYGNGMEKWDDKIIHYKRWINFKGDILTACNKQLKQNNTRKHIQQPSQPQSVRNVVT